MCPSLHSSGVSVRSRWKNRGYCQLLSGVWGKCQQLYNFGAMTSSYADLRVIPCGKFENMIAKYADEIDFDSLPDPDVYLQKRYIYESYKAYMKFRNKKTK